jgi:hypothetical protein
MAVREPSSRKSPITNTTRSPDEHQTNAGRTPDEHGQVVVTPTRAPRECCQPDDQTPQTPTTGSDRTYAGEVSLEARVCSGQIGLMSRRASSHHSTALPASTTVRSAWMPCLHQRKQEAALGFVYAIPDPATSTEFVLPLLQGSSLECAM